MWGLASGSALLFLVAVVATSRQAWREGPGANAVLLAYLAANVLIATVALPHVEANPRYSRGHYELARTLDESGRSSEALREFGVAEAGYREDGRFHLDYGRVLFRASRPEDAVAHLRKVLDLAPGSSDASAAGDLLQIIEGS